MQGKIKAKTNTNSYTAVITITGAVLSRVASVCNMPAVLGHIIF